MIDYDRQFKEIPAIVKMEMDAGWEKCRTYFDAKQAYRSAQRSEARGLDVAMARHCSTYYVWVGQR